MMLKMDISNLAFVLDGLYSGDEVELLPISHKRVIEAYKRNRQRVFFLGQSKLLRKGKYFFREEDEMRPWIVVSAIGRFHDGFDPRRIASHEVIFMIVNKEINKTQKESVSIELMKFLNRKNSSVEGFLHVSHVVSFEELRWKSKVTRATFIEEKGQDLWASFLKIKQEMMNLLTQRE